MQDLGFWRGFHGPFYGFEHVEAGAHARRRGRTSAQHYALWMEEQGAKDWRRWVPRADRQRVRAAEGAWEIPHELHYDTWIAERTEALLARHAEADEPLLPVVVILRSAPALPGARAVGEHVRFPRRCRCRPPIRASTKTCSPLVRRAPQTMGADWDEFHETGFAIHGLPQPSRRPPATRAAATPRCTGA